MYVDPCLQCHLECVMLYEGTSTVPCVCYGELQIVKKVELEAQRKPGRGRKRNPIEDLRREVAIMRTLRHKNIVSLQEVVDDPSGNKMLLVMDYMEGGPVMTRDALERGRCIPEPLALQYFRDMCKVWCDY
jgi:[calcium/calmodulin-dependent protein kinase] kinase